jgi:hypothetical protein
MAKSNAAQAAPLQHQHQQHKLSHLGEALVRRIADLPATMSIPQIAAEFGKPADTVRKQIRKGTFPLRVQTCGGERFVALGDYLRFLETGEIQTQPTPKRSVGRPTNASKPQGGAAC